MAKRKHSSDDIENLDSSDLDETVPDMGESALIASVDQHEAEMRGEANPPPPLEDEPTAPVGDGKSRVDLRVFLASGGTRWDQMAGFKSYATRQNLGPLSIPEWRAAFKYFMQRPVR